MQYKTIVLELLQQHPEIHQHLQSRRTLLATMELYARELKTSHKAWKARLSQALPGSNPSQIASEALEIINSSQISALIVTEASGKPVGIVNFHDLLRAGVA